MNGTEKNSPAAGIRSVAAIGDVTDYRAWSGIPFYFFEAARSAGFADQPWKLDLARMAAPRWRWNLRRILSGRRPGGFQYSAAFMRAACAQVPKHYFQTEIITFNQHFPPATRVRAAGGELNHYIDATFAALTSNRGLDLRLPRDVVHRGREEERANYAASSRIITMARWAAESVVQDCGVDPLKVWTILPGANIDLPEGIDLAEGKERGEPGKDREFTLGFVGMDWKRKGLAFLGEVRDELVRRGKKARLLVAGAAPAQMRCRPGVTFVGRIDKRTKAADFFRFLVACDVGCLFSANEALGISTLEFLRAGVPVAGFAHQGLLDTLPPDAGFRFPVGVTCSEVANVFETHLQDPSNHEALRSNAGEWSPLLTWERCVREMRELWQTGRVERPVQPWLGLPARALRV